jgi:hypothetical protein
MPDIKPQSDAHDARMKIVTKRIKTEFQNANNDGMDLFPDMDILADHILDDLDEAGHKFADPDELADLLLPRTQGAIDREAAGDERALAHGGTYDGGSAL